MKLGNWIAESFINESKDELVVVYAGRFQPFHSGHYKNYKHLVDKFGKNNVYICTSNKVQMPKSPMNFKEKQSIISKMFGINSTRIVEVKNPYNPKEILSKFNKDTRYITAVGQKDAGRLGGKYYSPYNADMTQGHVDAGYVYGLPRLSTLSGTDVRNMLSDLDPIKRKKNFKKIYGKFDQAAYDLITSKLIDAKDLVERFCTHFSIPDLLKENATHMGDSVDDGPRGYWGNQKSWKKFGKKSARDLGWEVLNYISGEDEFFQHDTEFKKDFSGGPTGAVSYFPIGVPGEYGGTNLLKDKKGRVAYTRWTKWSKHIATVAGYEFLSFMDADASISSSKQEPMKKQKPGEALTEGLLLEGGAWGHMNHPFDIKMNLTFSDLKKIVKDALKGQLKLTREKTDGQALAISWKEKGGLIAARNKGHLKDKGENAMNLSGVKSWMAGRGELSDGFNFAMKDLETALGKLSKKQRISIFADGETFMNLEVIWPGSTNVIPYGQALLIFHNTTTYDMSGNPTSGNQPAAGKLAKMIEDINGHVQDKYTIKGPPITVLPQSKSFKVSQSKYYGMITKLQSEFGLKDSDGLAEYHQRWWTKFINENAPETLDKDKLMGLTKRWAFGEKSFRLDKKTLVDEKLIAWAKQIDKKDHKKIAKNNNRKFEEIFLGLGAEVLYNMQSVLAVDPRSAARDMQKELKSAIADIMKKGDDVQIAKLKLELERLQSLGGMDKIVSNEGIVFVYKNNTYKLTGAFAPINQILGLFKYNK